MLLPVNVESGRGSRPPRATLLLIIVNAGVYLICAVESVLIGGWSWSRLVVIPAPVTMSWSLVPDHASAYSFFTAPWIHFSSIHLAGNLLFLWVFGPAAEEALGSLGVIGIYLAGGIASTFGQYVAAQHGLAPVDIQYAGSSGSVIAMIVVFAIRRYRARVRLWLVVGDLSIPAWGALVAFGCWYGLIPVLTQTVTGPSGYWGHLAGAVSGLILALVIGAAPQGAVDYSLDDALAQIEAGHLREGLAELHALQRLTPDDSRAPRALARSLVRVWDLPAASRHYAEAVRMEIAANRTTRAIEIWSEGLQAGASMSPQLALSLANAAAGSGAFIDAGKLYEWVLSQPDSVSAEVARRKLAAMRGG